MRILLLDHYDSFTYNLYQMLLALGADVEALRYGQFQRDIQRYDALILSPGPGSPWEYPKTLDLITWFISQGKPILGICLGHQLIGYYFGLKVIKANSIVHGKSSKVYHIGSGLFKGIKQGFHAGRYHSLIVHVPFGYGKLVVTAWTEDNTIMGIRHPKLPIDGIQFHPESVLTEEGEKIISNFLSYKGA